MTDIKKIFGNNVKKTRELQGITQEKLAELIGIGIPALSKIECGKSYPNPITISKIIEILNIKPYLLYIEEDANFDLEKAYPEVLSRIEALKSNKKLFKRAYDFILQLTNDL